MPAVQSWLAVLTKHVPRTRGLKPRNGGGLLQEALCLPNMFLTKHVPRTRGLKLLIIRGFVLWLVSPDAWPYQTCSPHTGIETLEVPADLGDARPLTKHVPRTRGLKRT